MKIIIKTLFLFIILISLASCGGTGNNSTETKQDSTDITLNLDTVKDIVLYNISSPLETFTILKLSSSSFDKSLLNPANKTSKYVSVFSKSINLGVYSTDLSFSFLYKQNKEFHNYIKSVLELTAALGIDGSYGESITKRLEANDNNLDSLMQIVSEATVNADLYLKENQRNNTTALIALGSWIEAMHIVTSIADKKQEKIVTGLVADQKLSIKNLIRMLKQFGADAEVADVLNGIKDISSIYDDLKPIQGDAIVSEDKSLKNIGNNTSYELTKEQLKSILAKVETLRNKLTL